MSGATWKRSKARLTASNAMKKLSITSCRKCNSLSLIVSNSLEGSHLTVSHSVPFYRHRLLCSTVMIVINIHFFIPFILLFLLLLYPVRIALWKNCSKVSLRTDSFSKSLQTTNHWEQHNATLHCTGLHYDDDIPREVWWYFLVLQYATHSLELSITCCSMRYHSITQRDMT